MGALRKMNQDAPINAKEELRQIIEKKSFITGGHFKLASGVQSSFFFDMKMTTLDPKGATLVADIILDMISSHDVDAVGGLELGACPIISAICVRSEARGMPISTFYVRKTPKKRGTQKMIEGLELKAGDRVVVLDDVTTAGGSVLQAVKEVKDIGCEITTVISVVDRLQGARERIENEGLKFESIFTKNDFSA